VDKMKKGGVPDSVSDLEDKRDPAGAGGEAEEKTSARPKRMKLKKLKRRRKKVKKPEPPKPMSRAKMYRQIFLKEGTKITGNLKDIKIGDRTLNMKRQLFPNNRKVNGKTMKYKQDSLGTVQNLYCDKKHTSTGTNGIAIRWAKMFGHYSPFVNVKGRSRPVRRAKYIKREYLEECDYYFMRPETFTAALLAMKAEYAKKLEVWKTENGWEGTIEPATKPSIQQQELKREIVLGELKVGEKIEIVMGYKNKTTSYEQGMVGKIEKEAHYSKKYKDWGVSVTWKSNVIIGSRFVRQRYLGKCRIKT